VKNGQANPEGEGDCWSSEAGMFLNVERAFSASSVPRMVSWSRGSNLGASPRGWVKMDSLPLVLSVSEYRDMSVATSVCYINHILGINLASTALQYG